MTKVDSTYPVKITPELSDRVWGFDPTSLKNTLFSIPGILDLNNSDIEPNAINVKRYPGVVGDGINDDTVGLQLALDEAAGRWVHFPPGDYFITEPLVLPENTRIRAYGARIFNHESHFYLIEVNSNCIIKGMELEGAGTTYDFSGIGIYCSGNNSDYKKNILLQDIYIHSVGNTAVRNEFTENVEIKNCIFDDLGQGGYIGISVNNISIEKSSIGGIRFPNSGGGYCVSFTKTSENLELSPRSKKCTVKDSLIYDSPIWKGLDTHCGEDISFINNTVTGCSQPIAFVPGNIGFPPINCKAIGNSVYGHSTKNGNGITVNGVSVESRAIGTIISNNYLVDCGIEGNSSGGSIRLRDTENSVISNNIIINPWIVGVGIQFNNKNFSIVGNVIQNPRSDISFSYGIHVSNENNSGVAVSNSFLRDDTSLNTYVGDITIRINPTHISTTKLTHGGNHNEGFLSENIASGDDIVSLFDSKSDANFSKTVSIFNPEGSYSVPIRYNHNYEFNVDNTGPGGGNGTRMWFSGPNLGSLYFHPRSTEESYRVIGMRANNINMAGAVVVTGSIRAEDVQTNVSGLANSGNSYPLGMRSMTVSSGENPNFPTTEMTVFSVKNSNSRTFWLGVDKLSNIWVRALHTADNNTWKRLRSTEGTVQTISTSGALNNLAIGATTDHLILTLSTSITGIIAGLEGRELIIENRNSVSIEFTADSGSSDSANRTAFTYTLLAGEMLKVKYANTKWRRVN